jgi:hypothetical protein|tara:strand:- start:33 stop:248 length:216 start_codon:yes stop_codon:yes gene_type:complete
MKRNDIELNNGSSDEDINSNSYKMIEEINHKIAELEKLNPNYKVILWKIKRDDWEYKYYGSNTRIILKDTY